MEPQIQSHGVYIKGVTEYVKAIPYDDNYIDYKHFDQIPFVVRADDNFEAIIYQKDLNMNYLSFGVRSFEIVNSNVDFPVDISPMEKEDMYKITSQTPLPKDRIMFINGVPGGDGRSYIIALGDIQEQLVKLFSDRSQTPVYAVASSLEDCCKSYPENKELQALLPVWQEALEAESDASDYKYVADAWAKYEDTEKIELQIRYLYETYREINGYVEKHPKGTHATEMLERQKWMDDEIEKLEKMV